jgi:hypothetical protein
MPTLKPTKKFKFLPHRTFSPKAFWLSHIAAHLQAPTSQRSNQRLAKELQFSNPLLLIILNPNFTILLLLFSRKVF